MTTETKPATQTQVPGEMRPEDMTHYLIISGLIVEAVIEADCSNCALRRRDAEYPGRRVALYIEPRDGSYNYCRKYLNVLPLVEAAMLRRPEWLREEAEDFVKQNREWFRKLAERP